MSAARATSQRTTVDAFVNCWKQLSIDGMASLYTTDLVFYGLPAAVLGGKPTTTDQWVAFIKPLWAELSHFEVQLHSITNDGQAGRAVIHAKTFGDLPKMKYRNEHIMVLHFNQDGTRIVKLEDMMDSVFALELGKYKKEHIKTDD